ncbi:imidazole glycerol phosphate synthase subunit HisF, partial [Staphylococcus aureus]|nr:imidazole glycerol phosphate synthase subunit HisF [Staphylococcus aureus]
KNPQLIKQASDKFGRQCICIAIDSYYDPERKAHYCCTHGGKKMTNIKVYDWVQQVEQLGAGELLITSMGHDGMKQGFDIEHLANIKSLVNIPIIASGGGGNAQHFVELFDQTDVSAGLAASILHDRETTVQSIKEVIRQGGIAVR